MALHVLDEANRCLGCKKPLCQQGCPIHTNIPEVIRLLKANQMDAAGQMLFENNPLTTVCSLVCNHENQCEGHCVRNRMPSHDPVHFSIIEDYISTTYANKMTAGPAPKNGMKAAVVGSGPAGLTIAVLLARWGYDVTIFDARDKIGGVMRYGIPNFKLGKHIIDRRIRIMEQEGILFRVNTMVGKEILAKDVVKDFDAVCVAIGAEVPRDLSIEGRHLRGVHFALELLSQQNRILEGIPIPPKSQINCKGKKVLVIGGGDTGSDCVGTANRHGAACVTQIEIMPQPPVGQNPATPWPMYPQVLKTSSSHEEGCIRRWNLASNRFIGEKNNLIGVEVEEVEWVPSPDGGRPQMRQTGKKEIIEADLVFLAMGFLHPEQEGLIKELRLATDNRDNIAVDNAGYTANSNGDAVSGASLVVKAMASGRNVARSIDRFLQTN